MRRQNRENVEGTKPRKKRTVLWIVLAVLAVGLALGGWQAFRILKQPTSLFAETAATAVPGPTILAPAFPIGTAVPERQAVTPAPVEVTPAPVDVTPVPSGDASTPDPTDAPEPTAAPTATAEPTPTPSPANRLNIMLMGIDAFENGATTSGTMPHTDVMMVIAINFDEPTVDLITLPRDTLTTAPGYHGIYKLNGVFNVGLGGWKRPTPSAEEMESGFLLTCRAAEEWLGGISIPYYYAVDFQAVIDIVDTIGGVDYDVDQPFSSHTGARTYGKGMRHLDGDAVLGYLRIRRAADGLDSSRTARQRRMMVAIYKKLKTEGKFSQIPSLIAAANSGIYTNTTLSQTTALANYAMKLDSDRIRTRSMFGDIGTREYEWRYAYVDQQNRIDIIREVFGIEAEPVGICTRQYERWLHTVGFSAMKYMRQAEKVLTRVQEMKNAGETFTEEQIALYGDCYWAYTALKDSFDSASETLSAVYAAASWREKKADRSKWTEENVAEDKIISAAEAEIQQTMNDLKASSRDATARLADSIGLKNLSWNVRGDWYNDPDINEVIVDFG